MIHQRRQIRQAIVQALINAGTSADDRVFDHPWNERDRLPALVVEDLGEQQRGATLTMDGQGFVERDYVVQVSAELQPADDWAQERDDLMAAVEAAVLEGAAALLPQVTSIEPAGYQAQDDMQAARPTYVGRQRFQIKYHTQATDPGVAV